MRQLNISNNIDKDVFNIMRCIIRKDGLEQWSTVKNTFKKNNFFKLEVDFVITLTSRLSRTNTTYRVLELL